MVRRFGLSVGMVVLMLASAAGSMPAVDRAAGSVSSASSESVPDVDCVSLVWTHFGPDPDEAASYSGIQMFSNGSAFQWYVMCSDSGDDYNDSLWESLGTDAFDHVLASMEAEGFWTMLDMYGDAHYAVNTSMDTVELAAAGPESSKSVMFERNAMIGLMPETYRLINMADSEDVSVEVSIVETSPLMYEVSCVLRNDRDVDISIIGVVEDFWHIIVVRENGCTFVPMGSILIPSVKDVSPDEEVVFEPKLLDASGYPGGDYIVLAPVSPYTGFAVFTVDGDDAYTNAPPACHCESATNESGSPDAWTFELLGCCDVEDRPEDIMVRWDWESDGEWDTDWSAEKVRTHTFDSSGQMDVTYELRDSNGATTSGTISVSVDDGGSDYWVVALVIGTAVIVVLVILVVALPSRRRRGPDTAP